MSSMIRVSEKTHKELKNLKKEEGLKSFEGVVRLLLNEFESSKFIKSFWFDSSSNPYHYSELNNTSTNWTNLEE